MIVYKTRIYSEKGKTSLEKSLTERLLNLDNPPIYIFPFCLFYKSFYKDKAVFIGKIINGKFNLETRSKIIATMARMPISLTGVVNDNEIEIKYQIPNYVIFIVLACILADLLIVTKTSRLNNAFYAIAGIYIVRYIFLMNFSRHFGIANLEYSHDVRTKSWTLTAWSTTSLGSAASRGHDIRHSKAPATSMRP